MHQISSRDAHKMGSGTGMVNRLCAALAAACALSVGLVARAQEQSSSE